jgi:N-acetylglucosamine malate deacetylase 1
VNGGFSVATLVVAPHADDEVLGAGGTLFKRKAEGESIAWLLMTKMNEETHYSKQQIDERKSEIATITKIFDFESVFEMDYITTQLDQVPMNDLVHSVSQIINEFKPEEIFLPNPFDIHSDHRVTFEVLASSIKWFRAPSVKRILTYETLSETELTLQSGNSFQPNVFVNIEQFLEQKIEAMKVYKSEISEFPFPRSSEAIRALSKYRGASCGFQAAEAFQLLRQFE